MRSQDQWRKCHRAAPLLGDRVRVTEVYGQVKRSSEGVLHTELYVHGVRTWLTESGHVIAKFGFQDELTVEYIPVYKGETLWN